VLLAVTGMLVIASAYGMARFGVGLFAPRLLADRTTLGGVLGWAGAAQFTSYCLAAALAARFVDRYPRPVLLLAGTTAVIGCAGVAWATNPAVFLAAATVGGMSGGLASAALVPIIDGAVAPHRSATVQSIANSGSAAGLIGAGLIALLPVGVEVAWLLMALFSGTVATLCWRASRTRSGEAALPHDRPAGSARLAIRSALALPGVSAAIAGAGSALVWSFGPLLVTDAGALDAASTGTLWIAAGVGGLSAILTGKIAERWGVEGAWCGLAVTTAAAIMLLGVALTTASGLLAIAAMIVFGGAYISLTGVLILWARRVAPGTAGAATSILFIAFTLGQAAGSALFGLLRGTLGPTPLIVLAAGLCAAGGLIGRAFPSTKSAVPRP
jgi:predicted MFS family arabinose efflux permease